MEIPALGELQFTNLRHIAVILRSTPGYAFRL